MTDPQAPTTEAGRLPTHCRYCQRRILTRRQTGMCYGCAKARAAALAGAAERVRALADGFGDVSAAAVLAILEERP